MGSSRVSLETQAARTGVAADVLATIVENLAAHPKVRKIAIYGSRGRGAPRYWSDIDVAVFAPGLTEIERSEVEQRWENAPIVYPTDLAYYDLLANGALRRAIDRDGITIYERDSTPSAPTAR